MKLLVSALEHSANIHLNSVVEKLEGSDTELYGIFAKDIQVHTMGSSFIDLSELAIMGFVDVLKKLPFYFKLNNQMLEMAQDADKILLIDSSAFNLPLAKKIKKRYPEKEIIYYILPQAWAWKKRRIPVLARTIDRLCSILPFEKKYYPEGAPIEYVGHPLLDQITQTKSGVTSFNRIAFMAGSRSGEITKLLPYFKAMAQQHLQEKECVLIIPKNFSEEKVKKLYGDISMFQVEYDARASLLTCDFAFICSGTATLEAALIGIPFVLVYIAKELDYFIASRLVKLNYLGLANLMHEDMDGQALHPELIQERMTLENMLMHYKTMDREKFFQESLKLREYLQHGSAARMAQILLK